MKKSNSTEKAAETKKKIEYDVVIESAKEFKEGSVVFHAIVNGVHIYNMWYKEYTNQKGEEGTMISFPSEKASDGKYYPRCFFPISKELKEKIIAQLEKLV